MADVAVETVLSANLETRNVRSGPVWTDENTGYVFFADGSQDVRYRKTTDGGASWAASVLIDATSYSALDVWFDKWTPGDTGTVIHIWWMEGTGDDVHYRSLDTATDTLGTDEIVFAGVSFETTSRFTHGISGTKAVGGNLYVQFWGDNDGERGFYRSEDDGDTWGSQTDGADGNAVDEVLCLPDADSSDPDDIVMIYWDRSANEISIKKYDDTGAGGNGSWSETSISGSMNDSTLYLQLSAVVRHSDGHIIVAAWTALDSGTLIDDLKVWDITLATPTITAKTDVITNTNDCVCVGLFIDQNTDDLYCAYLGDEDGSETWGTTVTAFYKKITAADFAADNAWGAQTAYQEAAADDEKYISAGHSTPGSAAGRFEPVWQNDDLNDFFVNKVNSVEITVVALTVGEMMAARMMGPPMTPPVPAEVVAY
jgi:hypothetical protein